MQARDAGKGCRKGQGMQATDAGNGCRQCNIKGTESTFRICKLHDSRNTYLCISDPITSVIVQYSKCIRRVYYIAHCSVGGVLLTTVSPDLISSWRFAQIPVARNKRSKCQLKMCTKMPQNSTGADSGRSHNKGNRSTYLTAKVCLHNMIERCLSNTCR